MHWKITNPVKNEFVTQIKGIKITIKREDLLHPFISGNKFRKLRYNLLPLNSDSGVGVATFGGAFSNHLAATAAAGAAFNLPTLGFVRGEELSQKPLNPTLQFCKSKGMQLHFLSRDAYAKKEQNEFVAQTCAANRLILIPEGGTNPEAIRGCSEILTSADAAFDTICCSIGTGGTFMGLLQSLKPHQHALGFLAVRDEKVISFLQHAAPSPQPYSLLDDFLFGGYAKTNDELVTFINNFYKEYGILLDPIYTGKLLFGIFALIKNDQWRWGKNVLAIHTGGIQGIKGFNEQQLKKGKSTILLPTSPIY